MGPVFCEQRVKIMRCHDISVSLEGYDHELETSKVMPMPFFLNLQHYASEPILRDAKEGTSMNRVYDDHVTLSSPKVLGGGEA